MRELRPLRSRWRCCLLGNIISEGGKALSSGGRPSGLLTFNHGNGIAIGVDIGEDHTRVALIDLAADLLVDSLGETDLTVGPEAVLTWVNGEITSLPAQVGRSESEIVGICLGLPAPVDWERGRTVGPSVMHGWDNFDIRGAVRARHDTTVIVDNDVNLLGLAEARRQQHDAAYLLYVKVGTGIGGAILTNGELYRGSRGAAGNSATSISTATRCRSADAAALAASRPQPGGGPSRVTSRPPASPRPMHAT